MQTTAIPLPFGLKDGVLIHIKDAVRGLACGCICPSCKDPLVAKKGECKEHHFAHASGAECASALETALHIAAKEILERRREIVLPEVVVGFNSSRTPIQLQDEQKYILDRVSVEARVDQIVPDVVAEIQGETILIEIYVTHRVDSTKLARIRNLGLSAIEIDLSLTPRNLSIEDIENLIIAGGSHKQWLYNAKVEQRKAEVFATGRALHSVQRNYSQHVLNCPIRARIWKGQFYVSLTEDCNYCKNAIHISQFNTVVCDATELAHQNELF